MLFGPAVLVIRRVVVALVLSVFVGVTAIAQTTPAWAAQYDVTATITVGSGPRVVAVSPDGTKAYVANYNADTVSVINTADNTLIATITVGTSPYGVAFSPDGTKVYVTNLSGDTVSVINTTTNNVDATITVGTEPYGVAVSPDGTTAYVTNSFSNTVSVIDLRANASASADPGVPGIFLTVAGPVGRSASESPVYYGADRVAVTSTYLLTMTRVSNIAPTITTLAEGTIDANGSFSSMTRLPALTPGVYNVQMVGTHTNGSTLQLTSQITIGGVGEFTSIGANIPVIK